MKIHSIDPETQTLKTGEVAESDLTPMQLERIQGLCPFIDGDRWHLPETLYTMTGPKRTADLLITTGEDKGPGLPGTADVRWLEARTEAGAPWIHRSCDILPIGIVKQGKAEAESIGA